jgi:hypothetical protein
MLTTAAIDALLKHIYQNLNWANIGDATGLVKSTADGNFYISLHTSDPGAGGSQTTNEATYTGYARIAVVRTSSGFTVASGVVSNAALAAFTACTAGSNSITHFGVGTASSGAGNLVDRGVLGTNIGPFVGENSNDTITNKGHGLSVNDQISFVARPGDVLPGGITEGTIYFVKTVTDVDNVTISATQGGATLDITTDGDGVMFKNTPLAVSAGITPQFAIGALTVNLA